MPSAQTETPISFAPAVHASWTAGPGAVAGELHRPSRGRPPQINLPGGCLPGVLTITTAGITIIDDAGVLTTGTGDIGPIDYANGILTLNRRDVERGQSHHLHARRQILRAPQSSEIPVTPESRSQSYVGTINPVPQPGTLSISYMAQGRWYVLSEQGDGSLRGLDSSFGVGTFNPNTGAFVVTLGALPDAPSSLIFVWNTPTQETDRPGHDPQGIPDHRAEPAGQHRGAGG